MSRAPLRNRRRQISCEFVHAGVGWTVSAGAYDDGSLGEIFLHCHKTASTTEALGRDAAILASIALQYGAPLDVMRHALTRAEDGGPATLAGAMLDEIVAQLLPETQEPTSPLLMAPFAAGGQYIGLTREATDA